MELFSIRIRRTFQLVSTAIERKTYCSVILDVDESGCPVDSTYSCAFLRAISATAATPITSSANAP